MTALQGLSTRHKLSVTSYNFDTYIGSSGTDCKFFEHLYGKVRLPLCSHCINVEGHVRSKTTEASLRKRFMCNDADSRSRAQSIRELSPSCSRDPLSHGRR